MFGTIALHCRLTLYVPGPHLSGFEYIAGHPGYLGPRVEPMNTDIETKDHFVCKVMRNNFNFIEYEPGGWAYQS